MISLTDYRKYGAIVAKVSAMRRNLLNQEDYLQLVDKTTVAGVAAYLKNETAYSHCLKDINELNIHREELERRLNVSLYSDVVKLYKFENSDNKKFYTYVFIKTEIEMIKMMLRCLQNNNRNCDWFADIPDFYKKYFTIQVDYLIHSKSIKEFLENLQGSRYESILSPLISLKEHQNLFSIEMTLDMYYYNLVNKLKDELTDKEDKQLMGDSIGSEIDMLNLLWIYRCKKHFKTSKEFIYAFIIPNRFKLKKETIIRLVEAANEDEFLNIVAALPYKQAFPKSAGGVYEQSYNSYAYQIHKKMYRSYPFSIEAVVSYLHFKEIEINNITSITEGIRYGLSVDEIKSYIIGFNL